MSHIRIKPLAGLLLLVAIWYFLLSSTLSFARIFSHPHAGVPLSQAAIKSRYDNHTLQQTREPVIPRKIHQIYHDWSGNVPHKEQWMRLRDSCINRNPGWQYKLWSSAESREFLQREYPWFLPTYDSYRYPVQRVDAMKYFIMRHYGGIYIDMDNGCLESLEPLRYYPVFVTDSLQGPLYNNILGAVPHHPFYEYVINHIWTYSLFYYPYPYLSVMYNSGQWFFTSMWEQYHDKVTPTHWNVFRSRAAKSTQHDDGDANNKNLLHRVIMDNRRGAEPWVFWNEGAGLTWQDWDYTKFRGVAEDAPRIIKIFAIVSVNCSLLAALVFWRCCCRRRKGGGGSNNINKNGGKGRLMAVAELLSPVMSPVLGKPEKKDHELV